MRRKKNQELIPYEKSRRIIYLDKRGRERKHMTIPVFIMMLLGILCLIYCMAIGFVMGYGTKFFLVWGVLGVLLIALGTVFRKYSWTDELPRWLKVTIGGVGIVCALIFLLVEGMILSQFWAKPPSGADYCLILGAQLKPNGPSDVLARRLNAAISYLEDNPQTQVIVSGGQGPDEPVSEAQGMFDYLTAAGIDPERIKMEAQSGNTYSNISNTKNLIDIEQNSVVIVTNNFHIFRSLGIAKKQGYQKIYGLAASSNPGILPNNLLREFFGVIKDMLVGNL